jgi:uncharacterized phage-like protein YoqJ
LPKEKIIKIMKRLNCEIDSLIGQGVTEFVSGGALGFEQLAASLILTKRQMVREIRLTFALPYKNQEEVWDAEQKKLYHNLLDEADEVIYISDNYFDGCMKQRNRYMVDRAAFCICALLYPFGGINQTVKYARNKGIKVINVAGK